MSSLKDLTLYQEGRKALDELEEALYWLTTTIEVAREPLNNEEYDPAAMRAELRDMELYLLDAKRRVGPIARIMTRLANTIMRLYESNSQAEIDAAHALQKGKEQMFQILMGDLTEDQTDQLLELIDQWTQPPEDIPF